MGVPHPHSKSNDDDDDEGTELQNIPKEKLEFRESDVSPGANLSNVYSLRETYKSQNINFYPISPAPKLTLGTFMYLTNQS